ncbi:MAG: ATP-binding protein [Acetobacter sp.]|nr:ATP-binding protein [Acetobacter sp.]MCH4061887.1 ATP-binding protein [Acetobacter sp.]MCH4089264.1 ATP-binding protein [Acetobacter sp.]MCI1294504.1 ATP-binding protein [Acetobacter sp.]MCI1321210.1 ATP-binding protein [Acetobacter sp.]
MSLTDHWRTSGFRFPLGVALAVVAALILQFFLVYAQISDLDHRRSEALLLREAALLAAMPAAHRDYVIARRATDDLRIVVNTAGVFTADHHQVAGEMKGWPAGLVADGKIHRLVVTPEEGVPYRLDFLAEVMPDGEILVLARSLHLLAEHKLILRRASLIAAVPVLLFALIAGFWLSRRALGRVQAMYEAIDRIMAGDIHERLPTGHNRDALEGMAASVNRMLDRLEQLMRDMREVGNDIAHDLRTPLARVRAGLDRALTHSEENGTFLRDAVDRAILDLDQCFTVITALLRMAEIDNGRRRDAFGSVSLDEIISDILDLYEPIAEAGGILLERVGQENPDLSVHGDRDLLIEALANLVDNAIKFTPEGGVVSVSLARRGAQIELKVSDTGPGIVPEEREAVLGRFYRSDKSRHIPGSGLGLSLVVSILRLHNARLDVSDAVAGGDPPGAAFTAIFPASSPSGVQMRGNAIRLQA